MAIITANVGPNFSVVHDPQFTFAPSEVEVTIDDVVGLDYGTGVNQINIEAFDTGTLTAAPRTLDLTALVDRWNNPVDFARVKYLVLVNDGTTDGQNLLFGPGATNPWVAPWNGDATVRCVVPPLKGHWQFGGPGLTVFPVTATSKTIVLDPQTFTLPYRLALVGVNI